MQTEQFQRAFRLMGKERIRALFANAAPLHQLSASVARLRLYMYTDEWHLLDIHRDLEDEKIHLRKYLKGQLLLSGPYTPSEELAEMEDLLMRYVQLPCEVSSHSTSPIEELQTQLFFDQVSEVLWGRDVSHGTDHALRVRDLSWAIGDEFYLRSGKEPSAPHPLFSDDEWPCLPPEDRRELCALALLHDVCDHKYGGGELPSCLREALFVYLPEEAAQRTLETLPLLSWTKRQPPRPENPHDWKRLVVQSADWVDALGLQGVERARAYLQRNGPCEGVDEKVRQHAHEKLLLLYEALPLLVAKVVAKRQHDELAEWVGGKKGTSLDPEE